MEKFKRHFNEWNIEKQKIDDLGATWIHKIFYINEKEVRYVKLGVNIWYEQDGKSEFKRAILVIKQIGNIFLVLPMTTKEKNNKYHYKLQTFTWKSSSLILSQIRTIDKKRFIEKIGEIGGVEFKQIKKNLRNYYFSDIL